jgi:hypothetical protein
LEKFSDKLELASGVMPEQLPGKTTQEKGD